MYISWMCVMFLYFSLHVALGKPRAACAVHVALAVRARQRLELHMLSSFCLELLSPVLCWHLGYRHPLKRYMRH